MFPTLAEEFQTLFRQRGGAFDHAIDLKEIAAPIKVSLLAEKNPDKWTRDEVNETIKYLNGLATGEKQALVKKLIFSINLAFRLKNVPPRAEEILQGLLPDDFFTRRIPDRVACLRTIGMSDGSCNELIQTPGEIEFFKAFLHRVIGYDSKEGTNADFLIQLREIPQFEIFIGVPPAPAGSRRGGGHDSHQQNDCIEEKGIPFSLPGPMAMFQLFQSDHARRAQEREEKVANFQRYIMDQFYNQDQDAVNRFMESAWDPQGGGPPDDRKSSQLLPTTDIDVTRALKDSGVEAAGESFDNLRCPLLRGLIAGEVIKLKSGEREQYIDKRALDYMITKKDSINPFTKEKLKEKNTSGQLKSNEYRNATEEYRQELVRQLTEIQDLSYNELISITGNIFKPQEAPLPGLSQ